MQRTCSVLLFLLALLVLAAQVSAGEGTQAVAVPAVDAPDGAAAPGPADWARAPRLPAGSVEVPWLAEGGDGVSTRTLTPDVRIVASGGRLHVRAEVAEPPGFGMGVSLMLAPDRQGEGGGFESVTSAAEAVALAYAPQDIQNPRFVARGPRGIGRATYRFDGTAEVSRSSTWSVEVSVPFADLGVAGTKTGIACAVVVRTRLPGIVAWAPEAAAFASPTEGAWFRLSPASGTWPSEPAVDEAEAERRRQARADADRADEARRRAWHGFQLTDTLAPALLLAAAGRPDLKPLDASREILRAAADEIIAGPLDRIAELQPDLAFTPVIRGHLYAQLGLEAEAAASFQAAREVVPGLLEALAGEWLEVKGPGLARGPVGAATDYEAAFARAAAEAAHAEEIADDESRTLAKDGVALGRAMLHERHGDVREASPVLDRLAVRYPTQPAIVLQSERTRRALEAWPLEQQRRAMEEKQGDLPRVVLQTTKGDIVLELFEDDQPNTVKNFVWLVEQGFYADQEPRLVVPFFGWIAGHHQAKPGYAIAAESPARPRRARRLYRGTIGMISADPDAVRAGFLLTTGTALHLDSSFVAFGRVVEGQEVVDAMTAADRIVEARVTRKRPGVEYRPLTVSGALAPPLGE